MPIEPPTIATSRMSGTTLEPKGQKPNTSPSGMIVIGNPEKTAVHISCGESRIYT